MSGGIRLLMSMVSGIVRNILSINQSEALITHSHSLHIWKEGKIKIKKNKKTDMFC